MEYQKITNLLDNTPNQPFKFKTRNWVEMKMNHEEHITKIIKLDLISMLRSRLCDYSDAYMLIKGTITVKNRLDEGAANSVTNKKVIFKNCMPFTNCKNGINNAQVDDAHDIDVVMPLYNLIELVIIIQKHLEFYGGFIEMYWL